MGKNTRVAVLMIIMFAFVQILEIEAIKLPCVISCALECLPATQYPLCFKNCVLKYCEMSISASNCATSCGVNKTITVDIGI